MSHTYHGATIRQPVVGLRQLEGLLGWDRARIRSVAYAAGRYYSPFDMRRPGSTKWRHIDNPRGLLKALQSTIYHRLLANVELPGAVMGGAPGRSTSDNAAAHVGQPTLATLDIASCYPSINHHHVDAMFRDAFRCVPTVASLLTKLTTFERRLPQGAPSSPRLSNLVLLPLFEDISHLAERHGFGFTVWVDDIVVSGVEVQQHIGEIIELVQRYGYAVRSLKTKVMHRSRPQEVTGVSTRNGLGVPGPYRQRLRRRIYELGTSADTSPAQVKSAWGQIGYVKSVCAQQGLSLERLAERYLPVVDPRHTIPRLVETRTCKSAHAHARRGLGSRRTAAACRSVA